MRRRGIRVFVIIAVLVALSIATLSFKEIHLSLVGAHLDAAGSGPLGITLGLDLQGGSHLVYQADLPDEVRVTFQDVVEEADLLTLLLGEDLKHTRATIAKIKYVIRDLPFSERAQEELRERLVEEVAPIESIESGDGVLEVTFVEDVPDEEGLRNALAGLGYTDAIIESTDPNQYTLRGLSLEERAQDAFRTVLEVLADIEAFEGADGVVEVSFLNPLGETDVRSMLNEAGYPNATIESPAQKRFTIGELSLDKKSLQEELNIALEKLSPVERFDPSIVGPTTNDMDRVIDTIQRRVNALGTTEPIIQTLGEDRVVVQLPGVGGSTVDVTFQSLPHRVAGIRFALAGMGRTGTGDTVDVSDLNSFVIETERAMSPEDVEALREALTEILGTFESFEESGENQVTVTFPPAPDDRILDLLLKDLGYNDFRVQERAGSSFTIRTDELLPTEDQNTLLEALEAGLGKIVAFEVTGGIQEAKDLIGGTAQLVFKERQCLASEVELRARLGLGGGELSAEDQGELGRALNTSCSPIERGGEGRFVDRDIGLTGEDLSKAFPGRDPTTNVPIVHVEFNSTGTRIFRDLTERLFSIGQLGRIAMFLDEEEISAPTVQSPIRDGRGIITGGFNREEARTLAIQLDSGRLPVPLKLIRESSVDALLGADSLRKSLIAGLVGLGLVLLFMVIYYRVAGLVAATSLLVYAVILLAIFKLIPVTLTLSGIAGLVLSIGIAVDANILIFERMKEEIRTGRTLASSMEVGFRRAWNAIRDSNVSTIITCLILWWFGSRMGTPIVTGFALTLLIGVLVSMFTAIMVSRNMLQILAFTPLGKRMALFTPEPRRRPVVVAGASTEPNRRGGA